jgi:hypothetical protein
MSRFDQIESAAARRLLSVSQESAGGAREDHELVQPVRLKALSSFRLRATNSTESNGSHALAIAVAPLKGGTPQSRFPLGTQH